MKRHECGYCGAWLLERNMEKGDPVINGGWRCGDLSAMACQRRIDKYPGRAQRAQERANRVPRPVSRPFIVAPARLATKVRDTVDMTRYDLVVVRDEDFPAAVRIVQKQLLAR